MSELSDEVITEENPSVLEEGESFLDSSQDEEPGFLDSLEERFQGLEQEEEEDSSKTPEGEEIKPEGEEEESEDKDLAEDFPKPEDLKDILNDEKSVAKWGELRNELASEREKTRELEAKLDATQSQRVAEELETQLRESRDQIQEYEQELSIARVERSPEYQKIVAEPLQSIMDAAENIIARYEGKDADTLFDALASSNNPTRQQKEIAEITEGMSDQDKFSVYAMVRDSAHIFAKDAELKEMAAEAVVELEAAERAKMEQASAKQAIAIRDGVKKVFAKLKTITPELSEGDLDALEKATLSQDFSSIDPGQQAYAVSASAMLPPLVKSLQARDKQIAQLKKDIAEFTKTNPKVSGSGVKRDADSFGGDDSDSTGFLESLDARLREANIN